MKQNIRNHDKNGNLHGEQINYYPNGNIKWIANFNRLDLNGYLVWFNRDKSIMYKQYYNMDKLVCSEDYYHKQIKIKI